MAPKIHSEMTVLKAEWMVTRKCNLNCSYCNIRRAGSLKGRPELDTESLLRTVKMFGKLWPGAPMVVYGGEPTMRDDLPALLRAGRDCGVKLPVISNSIRVTQDRSYATELVDSGLENWSVSFDAVSREHAVDFASFTKSQLGFKALKMFRDDFGIRDLVACITVTRLNIGALPDMLKLLTSQGVHAIFTPLHIGDARYEYGRGDPRFLPTESAIVGVSGTLREMVGSGNFLCSNDPEWFEAWPTHFLKQDWKCNDKGLVTIDADGSLKYCVDIPFRPEDTMFVWELEEEAGRQRFLEIIGKGPDCSGCLWNPAYECIRRARTPSIGIDEGRKRARHTVSEDHCRKLYGGAGRFFVGNPDLKRV